MEKKFFRQIMLLITFTVVLVFIMINFTVAWSLIGMLNTVLMPFYMGFVFAFLINMPYKFFADKAFIKLSTKGAFLQKSRKPLALITAYVIVLGILAFLVVILIPQLVNSANELAKNFSGYAEEFQEFLIVNLNKYFDVKIDDNSDIINFINEMVKKITGGELDTLIKSLASYLTPSVIDITKNVTLSIINLGVGLVVSLYLIGCKEKLMLQSKKLCYAFLSVKKADKVMEVTHLANGIFGSFVYGKIIDSIIMGILCFIGMSILGIDYALLISVIIGITNVVPVFGPLFGAVPSIFILLIIDPVQAVQFTIFILILQQIDGNFIGPKILGNSIGISGFWIMASVIVGGGMFGFIGMLLAVPLFSTFYVLLGEKAHKKLKQNGKYKDFENQTSSDIISSEVYEKDNIIINTIKSKTQKHNKENRKISKK